MKRLFANPHFLMIIYAVIVSLSFHVGHGITNDIEPVVLTFTRFFLGGVIFSFFVASRYGLSLPDVHALLRYTLISLTLVGYFFAMFYALRYTSAVNASLVSVTVPVFTTVFGVFILREYPERGKLVILLITMLGSMWVIVGGDWQKLIHFSLNKGDWIFLAGCVCIGMYPVLSKLLSRGEPTPVMTLWTLLTGAVVLALMANRQIVDMDWAHAPMRLYLGLVFITLLSTIVTFFIIQYASRRIPVRMVMAYAYIIPVFVMAEDVMLGGGLPSLSVWPGVVAVAAGTFFFMRPAGNIRN